MYSKVVELSKDLYTVCTALDAIIEVHSEDDMKHVYKACGLDQQLGAIKQSVLKMIREELKKTQDEEQVELFTDVQDNLEAFIDYKKKTLK